MKSQSKLTNELIDLLIDHGYFRNCLNCKCWNEINDMCAQFNCRPPTKVIVSGCEMHSDVIPF